MGIATLRHMLEIFIAQIPRICCGNADKIHQFLGAYQVSGLTFVIIAEAIYEVIINLVAGCFPEDLENLIYLMRWGKKTTRTLAESEQVRSGRTRCHILTDGGQCEKKERNVKLETNEKKARTKLWS
jgi:hypothetical protein